MPFWLESRAATAAGLRTSPSHFSTSARVMLLAMRECNRFDRWVAMTAVMPHDPGSIEVLPARNARDRRIFLEFPWRIYKADPLWVPPCSRIAARPLTRRRGCFSSGGRRTSSITWRGGTPVGTICAAEDKAYNAAMHKRECMFGFFECVEDARVAAALNRQAAVWAAGRGLLTLGGPFNLDYEDAYGVLIEGRDRPPVIFCGHAAYYQAFFEGTGFTALRGDNLAYEVSLDSESPALKKAAALAARIRQRGWITLRTRRTCPAGWTRWEWCRSS